MNSLTAFLGALVLANATVLAEPEEPLPGLTLEEVVKLYLAQTAGMERFQAEYQVVQKYLNLKDYEKVTQVGTFGIEGDRLAARTEGQHAVYENYTTEYAFGEDYGSRLATAASLFGHAWHTPALMFDRMQDTKFTPISRVLEDAIGPCEFGEAHLESESSLVDGHPCYVVEGRYDRVKFYQTSHEHPIYWKYRLHFDPRYAMQIVKMEFFDDYQQIPIGLVHVQRLVERKGLWIPVSGLLSTYAYSKEGERLRARPAIDSMITLDENSLIVNSPIDETLFQVGWAEARMVRDEIEGRYSEKEPPQQPKLAVRPKSSRWLWILNGVFLLFLGGVLAWRKWKHRFKGRSKAQASRE